MKRQHRILWIAILAVAAACWLAAGAARAETVYLGSLDLSKAKITGNITPTVDKTIDGKTLTINKKTYDKGICVNGYTVLYVNLNGGTDRFTATLGMDDESSVSMTMGGGRGLGFANSGAGAGGGRGARGADGATSATRGRGGRGARGAAGATSATLGRGGRGARGAAGATSATLGRGGRGAAGRGAGARGAMAAPVRSASFRILVDGSKEVYANPAIALGTDGVPISVDTKGVKLMVIITNTGGGGTRGGGGGGRGGFGGGPTHIDLADAKFEVSGAKPVAIAIPGEEREILTPKPGPAPKINGPVLTGVTPGNPVQYKIPATGTKPLTYSVDNLPAGLKVDAATGIITGKIATKGTYTVTLRAKNSVGEAKKEFKFVAEGMLSLTPPLGWNSWNGYGRDVSDKLARDIADVFVNKGLIDHGWTYINLDDGWERDPNRPDQDVYGGLPRDANGNFSPNTKFPDMKALGDYIHSKGLKFGIYSGPGPTTCQGLEASWQHEDKDAAQWASWGVDYLKYDWCSYNQVLAPEEAQNVQANLPVLKRPYQAMRASLDKVHRDIIYSLCQYGWGQVWEWGAEPDIRGNSWRTTGDISDNWQSMSSIGFNPGPRGANVDLSPHAAPGHWNDADMLEVGRLGRGSRDSNLTPAEQYTHITLWTLYPAPMLLGCDLTQVDDFTLGLLTNDEVLAVHQDPLGKGAKAVFKTDTGDMQVWARPLADGSKAVGLFNLDEMPMKVTAKWSDIGVTGKQTVRDLWRQKDLGSSDGEFTSEIPRHGCLLIKVTAAK